LEHLDLYRGFPSVCYSRCCSIAIARVGTFFVQRDSAFCGISSIAPLLFNIATFVIIVFCGSAIVVHSNIILHLSISGSAKVRDPGEDGHRPITV
jgi:hypothetical protein